jgi:hypothetical protein
MADNSQRDAGSPADSGRARRAPPTIDLEANEVTTAPKAEASESPMAGATEPAGAAEPEAAPAAEQPAESVPAAGSHATPRAISPWVIAPFSGAVAAALVIAVGWMLGWPQVTAPPEINASAIDDISARLTVVEAKAGKPVVDPALSARADTLDKSVASLRSELANLRARDDKLAAAVDELKAAPRDAAGNVDLSGINERIARLEQASRAQAAAIAQVGEKIAESKPADDLPLRRVVAASLLDVAVRHGDPYQSALAAAKALVADPDTLKPLDTFAATGVPSPPMLGREFLSLVPKFSPAETPESGAGLINRLQAGAAKLVRIERTDAVGNDRGAVVARATAAALRNDVVEARRELSSLSEADRAPAQAWLNKVEARDAALAASRQFADQAMAALAKTGQ